MNPRKWPDLAVTCRFPESARKILGGFGVRKIRYGYPGQVITVWSARKAPPLFDKNARPDLKFVFEFPL
jgi:hypothetical protein